LQATVNPATPAEAQAHGFAAQRQHRVVAGVGHNFPQENPQIFADAVLELLHISASTIEGCR
jgi:pimeloyl-ACP methyl ester carboxylesterase